MMEADGKNVNTLQTDISGDTFDNLLTNESVSIVTHIKNTWMDGEEGEVWLKNYWIMLFSIN